MSERGTSLYLQNSSRKTKQLIASAGSIFDLAVETSSVDVIAGDLILFAGTAIGQPGNHLETTAVNLSTRSVLGSTFVTETDSVTVTSLTLSVNRVNGDGSTTATTPDRKTPSPAPTWC